MIARELAPSGISAKLAEIPSTAPVYDFTDLLAKRYQQGDTAALEPLLRAVDAQLAPALAHARNHARALGGLPRALTHADLAQEAVRIVAELALRWDSGRGAFGAYVRVSLPWELAHAVKRFSASRGSATVTVLSIPQEAADALANRRAGADGRDWDNQLALIEALATLSPRQRALVVLLDCEGAALVPVALRLGLTRDIAIREHRRALERLRGLLTQNRPTPAVEEDPELLQRLLDGMLDGMHPSGTLPSRAETCRRSGLRPYAYERLMHALSERGVVAQRSKGSMYTLDFAAASELLEELGD